MQGCPQNVRDPHSGAYACVLSFPAHPTAFRQFRSLNSSPEGQDAPLLLNNIPNTCYSQQGVKIRWMNKKLRNKSSKIMNLFNCLKEKYSPQEGISSLMSIGSQTELHKKKTLPQVQLWFNVQLRYILLMHTSRSY